MDVCAAENYISNVSGAYFGLVSWIVHEVKELASAF